MNNTFANIVRDRLFWHRTADLRAKLVLGAPNGNAKHQLGEGIGYPFPQTFVLAIDNDLHL